MANKNALTRYKPKAQEHAMTQVFTEGNFNSREDTLLKNTGESYTYQPQHYDPNFIGPRDATDHARGLLLHRAKALAEIAVMRFDAYEDGRAQLIATTHESVKDGILRLNGDYKNMTVTEQVEHFVVDAVQAALQPREAIEAQVTDENVRINLASKGPERALQVEVNGLKESVQKQSSRILKVRAMLVEGGATEEFMREFDYTTKLMTTPDLEAYEQEMKLDPEHETPPLVDTGTIKLFEMFKTVLSPSFGRKALRSIGILSPKSGEVQVVKSS